MDKESVILKYEQIREEQLDTDLKELSEDNKSKSEKIDSLNDTVSEIYKLLGKESKEVIVKTNTAEEKNNEIYSYKESEFDEIFEKASLSLSERGFDLDDLDYTSLVSDEELQKIEKYLNRPISKREKWTKADFIVVFIAASIGSLADIILSNRDNKYTRKSSDFSEWLTQFHDHKGGAPIDYQGKNFESGYHRVLSKGHDILRFIEAIAMFKNGQFEAIRYVNGNPVKVVTKFNQYGKAYEQLPILEAISRYLKHMFADLFSTYSLPFPGYSFLIECDNRQIRKFTVDMYKNGFNCKNIMIQGLSTAIIEIIIRAYFSIMSVKKMDKNVEIDEDYSNFDKVKEFLNPSNKDKLLEMLLVAHSVVTAINVGKVVIDKAPWGLNVTEIIAVVRYGIKVIDSNSKRNSEFGKLIRTSQEIHNGWIEIEDKLHQNELISLNSMDSLIII